ncbi:hypothetical protein D9615_006451 [Tricholomella constricta]|uniref:Uncharacterized protein n=1 Tax=Tricholomella constricta TaxID=117010 RepID=A0A8H5H5N9_9AGAR|nr:hypothetical protein D9615_006451 [Tricholomella constricta]
MANATRSLVSYDDITLPYQESFPPQPHAHSPKPPPAKKRKWSKKPKGRHRDDSQSFNSFQKINSDNEGHLQGSIPVAMEVEDETPEEEDEGRDLTHDEIWDDSALIDAWNAATEEYEAYNGPDKGWKRDPVHNSPLWYNIPKAREKTKTRTESNGAVLIPSLPDLNEQNDSRPLNFDTFIPSHDPSLDVPLPELPSIIGPDGTSQFLCEPPGPMVSQDEAFMRAMGSMYWSGYWTAMYHCQRRLAQAQPVQDGVGKGEEKLYGEDDEDEDEDDDEEEAVPPVLYVFRA